MPTNTEHKIKPIQLHRQEKSTIPTNQSLDFSFFYNLKHKKTISQTHKNQIRGKENEKKKNSLEFVPEESEESSEMLQEDVGVADKILVLDPSRGVASVGVVVWNHLN